LVVPPPPPVPPEKSAALQAGETARSEKHALKAATAASSLPGEQTWAVSMQPTKLEMPARSFASAHWAMPALHWLV
jgi:hypothetical protein